jgi:hypothetical protein
VDSYESTFEVVFQPEHRNDVTATLVAVFVEGTPHLPAGTKGAAVYVALGAGEPPVSTDLGARWNTVVTARVSPTEAAHGAMVIGLRPRGEQCALVAASCTLSATAALAPTAPAAFVPAPTMWLRVASNPILQSGDHLFGLTLRVDSVKVVPDTADGVVEVVATDVAQHATATFLTWATKLRLAIGGTVYVHVYAGTHDASANRELLRASMVTNGFALPSTSPREFHASMDGMLFVVKKRDGGFPVFEFDVAAPSVCAWFSVDVARELFGEE